MLGFLICCYSLEIPDYFLTRSLKFHVALSPANLVQSFVGHREDLRVTLGELGAIEGCGQRRDWICLGI